jgi:hypothetical protein
MKDLQRSGKRVQEEEKIGKLYRCSGRIRHVLELHMPLSQPLLWLLISYSNDGPMKAKT